MLSVYNYNWLGPILVNLGTVQLHWLETPLGKITTLDVSESVSSERIMEKDVMNVNDIIPEVEGLCRITIENRRVNESMMCLSSSWQSCREVFLQQHVP